MPGFRNTDMSKITCKTKTWPIALFKVCKRNLFSKESPLTCSGVRLGQYYFGEKATSEEEHGIQSCHRLRNPILLPCSKKHWYNNKKTQNLKKG